MSDPAPPSRVPGARPLAPLAGRLRGVAFWVGAAAIVLLLAAPTLSALALDRGDRAIHFFQRLWGRLTLAWLRLCGVRFEFSGLEHLELPRSAVLVSNHQSILDIIALSRVQPPHTRWVVKRELRPLPVVGWAMRMAGFVFVDRRGDAESVRRSFAAVEAILRQPGAVLHLLFFAEGTRTRDGKLRPFKRGAFRVATTHTLPLLPIAVSGAYTLMPRGRFAWLGAGRVRLRVLPPIEPSAPPMDEAELAARTRARIEAALRELEAAEGG